MRRKKSLLQNKIFLGILLLAVLVAGGTTFMFSRPASGRAHASSKEVFYPTPYSYSHISKNAIISDPRFAHLHPANGQDLLAAVLGSPPSISLAATSTEPEVGSWIWTPLLQITPSERDTLIAGAVTNGVRNLYLSLDSYLDIYALPDGPQKDAQEKSFNDALTAFITEAKQNGLTVDAEGGWQDWAEPGNTYKAFALLDYAMNYNATHTNKLRGFQYDIEPYLLPNYQNNKAVVLGDFLDLIYATVTKLNGSDLAFSVVIPDFYDATDGDTPEFWYGIDYGYTLDHLLAILERRPASSLIVMAYSNTSSGSDGSIEGALDEVKAADRSKTKVIIAQETSDVSPSSVTFYDTSRAYLDQQVSAIQSAFANDPSYHGIAFHYLASFMALQ